KLIHQIINSLNFKGTIINHEDLIGIAYLALHKCVENFDLNKNFSFSTYLVEALRKAFIREIEEKRCNIGLPQNSVKKFKKAEAILKKNEAIITPETIAEESGLSLEETNALFVAKKIEDSFSIYMPLLNPIMTSDDDFKAVEYSIPDPTQNVEEQVVRNIAKEYALNLLTALEKKDKQAFELIKLYYGINEKSEEYTLEEIGKAYKISRERVRQIIQRGIKELKEIANQSNEEFFNEL
ncbi:MAG: sigma-70 family RNA polymerase sigma factor, partial [Candidatus Anstonellales archaeon]